MVALMQRYVKLCYVVVSFNKLLLVLLSLCLLPALFLIFFRPVTRIEFLLHCQVVLLLIKSGLIFQVFAEFRGTTGKFTRQLTHQMDPAVPSAFIATLPPFQFHSGSTENFNIKGPDIGELMMLIIQVSTQCLGDL